MRAAIAAALLIAPSAVRAQSSGDARTVLSHPDQSAVYVGGQINLIAQAHGPFPALYTGSMSFKATRDRALSRVITLYTGIRLPHRWEVIVDIESAGGTGLSAASGLAGFTDLDVVRNPTLGANPYLARVMVRKIIALSTESAGQTTSPLALSPQLPARRIEVRAGRMGLVDFLDINSVGSDSHLQFTNWTIDNTGAFDYAADTRGYTYAAIAEYDEPRWSVRAAEALMPTVANGITLDWDVTRARGENVEYEWRGRKAWTVRVLGYANHANMGSYREAIDAFTHGEGTAPDIVAHRRQGRVKYGTAANAEYRLANSMRLFARGGWNSGDTESFAYTEVNDTLVAGGDASGHAWRRDGDRIGVALASNGLSAAHREYLRLGGAGFLLGDGTLNYRRETIVEGYYTAHVWRGVFASAGGSFIVNPGYNRDRGPVFVETARVHVDF